MDSSDTSLRYVTLGERFLGPIFPDREGILHPTKGVPSSPRQLTSYPSSMVLILRSGFTVGPFNMDCVRLISLHGLLHF